ncbi:hypothetical protein T492DRAFT_843629 [Pavlovales sp. CCMP2436]|nr:hypothetical protein T492DRAFT_843629 [Pavlovales sp. CCMP2436]
MKRTQTGTQTGTLTGTAAMRASANAAGVASKPPSEGGRGGVGWGRRGIFCRCVKRTVGGDWEHLQRSDLTMAAAKRGQNGRRRPQANRRGMDPLIITRYPGQQLTMIAEYCRINSGTAGSNCSISAHLPEQFTPEQWVHSNSALTLAACTRASESANSCTMCGRATDVASSARIPLPGSPTNCDGGGDG